MALLDVTRDEASDGADMKVEAAKEVPMVRTDKAR